MLEGGTQAFTQSVNEFVNLFVCCFVSPPANRMSMSNTTQPPVSVNIISANIISPLEN